VKRDTHHSYPQKINPDGGVIVFRPLRSPLLLGLSGYDAASDLLGMGERRRVQVRGMIKYHKQTVDGGK
jgi:hypothetical protein